MDFTRGQRLKLEALGLADAAFSVTVELNAGPLTVDVACFGLDGARKLSDERYMTFFNQPTTPCGAVKLKGQGKFDLDLARLPASIDALVMTLAIDGSGTMRQGRTSGPVCLFRRRLQRLPACPAHELPAGQPAQRLLAQHRRRRLAPAAQHLRSPDRPARGAGGGPEQQHP